MGPMVSISRALCLQWGVVLGQPPAPSVVPMSLSQTSKCKVSPAVSVLIGAVRKRLVNSEVPDGSHSSCPTGLRHGPCPASRPILADSKAPPVSG